MWTRLLGAALLAASAVSAPVIAQSQSPARPPAPRPRLTGSWEAYPLRGEGFGSGVAPKIKVTPPPPISEPPLRQPYLDEWRATQARNAELTRKGLPPPSSGMACMPEGMPGMMQATFPMEILETPGQITVIEEAFNQVRRIYLGAPVPALDDAEPRFGGHSVGRWEGSVLVVTTVAVKDVVHFRNTPHSNKARITERLRLVNDEILENKVTLEDPEYLTQPWTWTWMYKRWPGYKIQEYVCEDNRYFEDPALRYQRLRVN